MKKIVSIIMITLIGLTIIPKTLTNERHTVLEGTTSVYTKEEVDNLLSTIRSNITNNTNELTNIKSELTSLQNSLKDYALKTSLNTTNSNIDDLNTVVTAHESRIEFLENTYNELNTYIDSGTITFNFSTSQTMIPVSFNKMFSEIPDYGQLFIKTRREDNAYNLIIKPVLLTESGFSLAVQSDNVSGTETCDWILLKKTYN